MRKAAEISCVIFDLDGTLVDTEPAAAKAVMGCFKKSKIDISENDAGFITGRTWESAFEFLFEKYPVPIPTDQAAEEMIEAYRKALRTSLGIVPGSAQAVTSLAGKFALGLVSGSHRTEILFALDHLKIREHFEVILGAEDYLNSKPAPDGYLKAFELLGVKPGSVLIFEDSAAGIQSAKAAGAWVVAVTGTNHFSQDVTSAHGHVPDLQPVNPEWVKVSYRENDAVPRSPSHPARVGSTGPTLWYGNIGLLPDISREFGKAVRSFSNKEIAMRKALYVSAVAVSLAAVVSMTSACTKKSGDATLTTTGYVASGGTSTASSGLKIEDSKVGSGAEAVAGKTVTVHYSGYLTNGKKFDSSLDRGQPFKFTLGAGQVIKGWDQGVAGMKVGGKRKLTIPPDMGYGERGAGNVIPPNATLVFDVELLNVE